MIAFGVDGCRGGWVAASAASGASRPAFTLFATFDSVVSAVQRTRGVACVDMPIGLRDGTRRCDVEARALLGRARASSVFPAPARRALDGTTAEQMRKLNVLACGKSLSAQALNILPKIREVDRAMTPSLQRRIREAHPEVIFARRAGGRGLASNKKTSVGRTERLGLLPAPFRAAFAEARFPRAQVAADDLIDALALLLAALRVARGMARALPARPERDERRLAMEIVC